jgi:hypothetical protein
VKERGESDRAMGDHLNRQGQYSQGNKRISPAEGKNIGDMHYLSDGTCYHLSDRNTGAGNFLSGRQ